MVSYLRPRSGWDSVPYRIPSQWKLRSMPSWLDRPCWCHTARARERAPWPGAVCEAAPRALRESRTAGRSASRTRRAPRAENKPSSERWWSRRVDTDDGGGGGGVSGARTPVSPGGGGCVTRHWSTGQQGRADQCGTRSEHCLKTPWLTAGTRCSRRTEGNCAGSLGMIHLEEVRCTAFISYHINMNMYFKH